MKKNNFFIIMLLGMVALLGINFEVRSNIYTTYSQHKARLAQEQEMFDNPFLYAQELSAEKSELAVKPVEDKIQILETERLRQQEKMQQLQYQQETEQTKQRVKEYKEKLQREESEKKQCQAVKQNEEKAFGIIGSISRTYKTFSGHRARLAKEKQMSDNSLLYAQENPFSYAQQIENSTRLSYLEKYNRE